MTVEYLTIDAIIKKFSKEHFYLAHFSPSEPEDEYPFSDKSPYKARLKWNHFEINPIITICSKHGEQKARDNPYYTYMVSDNLDELEDLYKSEKRKWIKSRRDYLESQIKLIEEMEKECF